MAPYSSRNFGITTEMRQPHVITLLFDGQPIGTIDLRQYMPWHTKIRVVITRWLRSPWR